MAESLDHLADSTNINSADTFNDDSEEALNLLDLYRSIEPQDSAAATTTENYNVASGIAYSTEGNTNKSTQADPELLSIDLRDLEGLFTSVFPKLDKNNDSFVDQDEIQARRATATDPKEQVLLQVLSSQLESLQELSNDEWGDENNGITLKDMNNLHRLQAQRNNVSESERDLLTDVQHYLPGTRDIKDPATFGFMLEDKFKQFDQDGDYQITNAELSKVLAETKPGSELHELAKGVEMHYKDLTEMDLCTTRIRDWTNPWLRPCRNTLPYITWSDAHDFRYRIDPRHGFNDNLLRAKLNDYSAGTVSALTAAGIGFISAKMAVLAVVDPEPFSKVAITSITAGGAYATKLAGEEAYRLLTRPSEMRQAYEEDNARIRRWQFFKK